MGKEDQSRKPIKDKFKKDVNTRKWNCVRMQRRPDVLQKKTEKKFCRKQKKLKRARKLRARRQGKDAKAIKGKAPGQKKSPKP